MDLSQDLEHYGRVLAGCESAYHHANSNTALSADGKYAFAVLSLHAGDAGIHAGQEGFMDAIKKGATKAKDWIMKILKAIREWLGGTFKITIEIAKRVSRDPHADINEIASTTILNPLKNLLRAYEELKAEGGLTSSDINKAKGHIEKAIGELEKGDKASSSVLWPNIVSVHECIDTDVHKLASLADAAAAKIPTDLSHADYNELSKKAMDITADGKDLVSAANSFTSSMVKLESKSKALGDKKEEKEE